MCIRDRPITLGPDVSTSINTLVATISKIADYPVEIDHVPGPEGVKSRHFDHAKRESLGLKVGTEVETGMKLLYDWIEREVEKSL